jgi:hypothetical protein
VNANLGSFPRELAHLVPVWSSGNEPLSDSEQCLYDSLTKSFTEVTVDARSALEPPSLSRALHWKREAMALREDYARLAAQLAESERALEAIRASVPPRPSPVPERGFGGAL